ncbi:MAG TPA: hypothetical protein VK421_00665 [Pyrinomonadaceae bacterium]|nr:hypothetical protein [Pyrinomonadaceae bacterium]
MSLKKILPGAAFMASSLSLAAAAANEVILRRGDGATAVARQTPAQSLAQSQSAQPPPQTAAPAGTAGGQADAAAKVVLESGTYTVNVEFPAAQIKGQAELEINGDTFTLRQDDKVVKGRVSGRSERGHTSFTLSFEEFLRGVANPNDASPYLSVRALDVADAFVRPGESVKELRSVKGESKELMMEFLSAKPSIKDLSGQSEGGTGPKPTPTPNP